MSQQALDFGRDHRVAEAQRKVLLALNNAVDAVGLMVAAGACGCRTQDLSDALGGRANRYVRVDWVLAIADVAPPSFREPIVKALVEWLGFGVGPVKPMTGDQKAAAYEARLRALGAFGEQLMREALG